MEQLNSTQKFRRTPKGVLTNMYDKMRFRHPVDFTLSEFHTRYLQDKLYLKLFKDWEESGYNIQLKPSPDRTNCKIHYTFGNIKMMTWAENKMKGFQADGKLGRKSKTPRIIQMLGNKIIKIFERQDEVIKELKILRGSLSKHLNGKTKNCHGYTFIYEL